MPAVKKRLYPSLCRRPLCGTTTSSASSDAGGCGNAVFLTRRRGCALVQQEPLLATLLAASTQGLLATVPVGGLPGAKPAIQSQRRRAQRSVMFFHSGLFFACGHAYRGRKPEGVGATLSLRDPSAAKIPVG